MKHQVIIQRITLMIIPLVIIAAGCGLFWQGTGDAYSFHTLRGEDVMIQGHGLYRFDTVSSASQEIAQDAVNLFLGVPLLAIGVWLSKRSFIRGRLLLTGSLGYFLYTYASMSFLTAFNHIYLVYVAIFSLSLFGFILALSGIDVDFLREHFTERFPRKPIAMYFLVVAVFLSFAWLGLVVSPMISGNPPSGLESAITMVIQTLDLGVVVPTAIITAVWLFKNKPWGYTLSTVILIKIIGMGTAIIAMVINQILAGVKVDVAVSVIFVVVSLVGIGLAGAALKSVKAV
jgi:hypothetical protein